MYMQHSHKTFQNKMYQLVRRIIYFYVTGKKDAHARYKRLRKGRRGGDESEKVLQVRN